MVEPIDQLLDRAAGLVEAGRPVALCLLARARGSTPATTGALMIVNDAAETFGTIGGGCVEAEIRRQVFEMMAAQRGGVLRFTLDHDYGWDDGLICGGTVEVAVSLPSDALPLRDAAESYRARRPARVIVDADPGGDPEQRFVLELPPRPRLLIAGAGHVGQALCRLALELDFDVAVYDDRHDLLAHFPDPVERCPGSIRETIARASIDDNTYIVIVTRGHKHDEEVLEAVVASGARYVGMIGSRRKVKLIFDDLRERGVAAETLDRVHAPIGVEIGSATVNEIALSIAAQLVAVRRDGARDALRVTKTADAAPR